MKRIVWIDKNGYKHASLLRDSDPDSNAHLGIPQDPPDLRRLDWDGMIRDLHNLLVENGLGTWNDVQAAQTGIQQAIITVFRSPIVRLYKTKDGEPKSLED